MNASSVDFDAVASQCPDIEQDTLQRHWDRLEPAYLERFGPEVVAEHAQCLASLDHKQPARILTTELPSGTIECTVIAFDHPFEFSLIAGVLSGTGFTIDSGDVFTLPRVGSPSPARGFRRRPGRLRHADRNGLKRASIIDCFRGRLLDDDGFDAWRQRFEDAIREVIGLLEEAREASVAQAKKRVNELVTDRLNRMNFDRPSVLLPVRIEIDQIESGRTRLNIVAQDTPAFLYSLATALSLHGLSIQHVRIRTEQDQVADEIHVVNKRGEPVTDPNLLERVRLSVLLTKQFTYFLDQAPDPFTALTRFEQLAEEIMRKEEHGQWFDLLANPRTMQDLAKLLGTSDYLWEDFIRTQYESLEPVFTTNLEGRQYTYRSEQTPLRMERALAGADSFDEQRKRFNRFKDREIFLIDLDHLLTPGVDFRGLSQRLTLLAEVLVASATQLVFDHLVGMYGQPRRPNDTMAPYAVFGLGKLGGVALGYASDIELLFMYDSPGKTTGGSLGSIDNAEFFQRLAQDTSTFIETKRKGIFEVDLRLRPYGRDGPIASSVQQFEIYYGPEGPAHPFERLALVRLRWIGGSPSLGSTVEKLRDRCVYEGPPLNLDDLWETWAKQRREKTRSDVFNAKYDAGALVDFEGTLQLLQLKHADHVPQLRSPRLSNVLESLRRGGVLNAQEFADLVGAYRFFRQLINGLRILRGDARDLFLPPVDSDECIHLARRMGYEPYRDRSPAQQVYDEFKHHTDAVKNYVQTHFGRPVPGA